MNMQSLLDDVNELLSKKYGDTSRLLHIKETIEKNKILYTSDRKFLSDLCKTHLGQKNPEVKKQKYVKDSKKLDDQLYSVNENTVINENMIGNDESNLDMHKIRESNIFCNNCGSKILEKTQFCMECGNSLDNPSQTNISTTPQSYPQYSRQGGKPSATWYLLPIFFSIIGGIIAWACIKDRDPSMAKNNLILGILLTVIPMIFGVVLVLGMISIPYLGFDAFR
jgi:hypothetical protein